MVMISAAGLQTNAIVVSIRAEQADEFERLFADDDARFTAFLKKARQFQPSSPFVWGGRTIHARPETVSEAPPPADEITES